MQQEIGLPNLIGGEVPRSQRVLKSQTRKKKERKKDERKRKKEKKRSQINELRFYAVENKEELKVFQ